MSKLLKYSVGIDASKDELETCLMEVSLTQDTKIKATRKLANTPSGFKELHYWLKQHHKEAVPMEVLMEATGVYYEGLAISLVDEQYPVSVVLPNKARKYMRAMGLKSKNDSIDAKGLALMCAQQKCTSWQPIAKYYYGMRSLTRHHEDLQKQKTAVKNKLHAIEHSAYDAKEVAKQLCSTLAITERQIKKTKQLIVEYVNSNEEVRQKVENIVKIKGVDVLSVATVIAETNGFLLIKNVGQLVSYAGYDVIENQSGKHVGKTRISKEGNSHIRRILHMPALNVARWEPDTFGNLYHRVYERSKIKMKGYVAVQKKLLVIMYALWKKNEPFDSKYGSKTSVDKTTSGNVESRALFSSEDEQTIKEVEVELVGIVSHSDGLVSQNVIRTNGKKIVPRVIRGLHKMDIGVKYHPRPSFREAKINKKLIVK